MMCKGRSSFYRELYRIFMFHGRIIQRVLSWVALPLRDHISLKRAMYDKRRKIDVAVVFTHFSKWGKGLKCYHWFRAKRNQFISVGTEVRNFANIILTNIDFYCLVCSLFTRENNDNSMDLAELLIEETAYKST